nr:hypothetical protein [Actinomyces sp.]
MTTAAPRRPEDHGTPQEVEYVDPAGSVLTPASTERVFDDLEVPAPAPVLDDAEPATVQADPVTGAAPTTVSPLPTGPDQLPDVLMAPAARTASLTPSAQTPPEVAVGQEAQSAPGRRSARHAATQDDPSTTAVRRRSLFAREEEATEQPESVQPSEAAATPAQATSVTPPAEAATSTEDDDTPVTPVWPRRTPEPRSEEDILLDGSVVVGRPASRAAAHWAGVLLSLVLLPPAWFFLHDAATHLVGATEAYRFAVTTRGVIELVVSCLLLALALWTARRSSLGTFVVGALTLVVGLPGLVAPGPVDTALSPFLTRLAEQSTLGQDVATMVWSDAVSGRFLAAGLALVMVGVVSHSARRAGRREQEVIDRVRHVG